MREFGPLLVLLALVGGALTLFGAAFAWFLDETRRIRRTLAEGLGAVPEPMLAANGRGVGFDLAAGAVAVTWDKGAWRLPYRVDELVGVELIVDRQVAARAFRGEPRRPLEQLPDARERVRLRFVFDDPRHPDFDIDLWRPGNGNHRSRPDADEALGEANRWMARMESLLRDRPPGVRPAVAPARPAAGYAPPHDDGEPAEAAP